MVRRARLEGPAPPRSPRRPWCRRDGRRSDRLSARPSALPAEDGVHGRRQVLLGEGRDGTVEDDAEPLLVDRPTHDVERARPGALAAALDRDAAPRRRRAARAAAAPSPNSATATRLALSALSSRTERVQSSTTTSRTLEPGRGGRRRVASDRPVTPPAQPSPKTGNARDVRRGNPSGRRRAPPGSASRCRSRIR